MSANWGSQLQLSIFGESHQEAVGINISGLPAGFLVDEARLQEFLRRRQPGRSLTSPRQEKDTYHILSGIKEGRLTGAPLAVLFLNEDRHSQDYDMLSRLMRPGHSDYPAYVRFHGFADVRGGGHFSARLTAPICFAGGLIMQILETKGIHIDAHIRSIGEVEDLPLSKAQPAHLKGLYERAYPVFDLERLDAMLQEVQTARLQKDSVGGRIEAWISGLEAGYGEPFFDSMESILSHLLFSIPACKGVLFGDACKASRGRGSVYNDAYAYEGERVVTCTNHHGGILGGLTSGMPIWLNVLFKPTPSISLPQQTINVQTHSQEILTLTGRHDPCVVLRAEPVVRAMLAIGVYEMILRRKGGDDFGA